ncbi:MAG: DUF983 domain-containing protein [Flavobacteriaceae bacterium]|nr:DUF983 domain-containing protein [Flavobacteriaceae bacterium]
MSFLKGTKIYSIFTGKCPVCQEGKMYESSNAYHFSKTLKMNERCSHCDTKFKIEPSFFYGAMYVSYGVGVAFAIAAFVIAFFFLNLNRFQSFLVIVGTLIILLPIIVRLSRNIWINFFFKFDRKKTS